MVTGAVTMVVQAPIYNEQKTGEPEVPEDPLEGPRHNNGETVEGHNNEFPRQSIPQNCPGNYILKNETSQQLDPYYTHPENFMVPR